MKERLQRSKEITSVQEELLNSFINQLKIITKKRKQIISPTFDKV